MNNWGKHKMFHKILKKSINITPGKKCKFKRDQLCKHANLEERKQGSYFIKDHKCLVREKHGESIRVSALANMWAFDWFLHDWSIKVNFTCVLTSHRLLACLFIHSRAQNEHSFPTEQVQ